MAGVKGEPPLQLPAAYSPEWAGALAARLDAASRLGEGALQHSLPPGVAAGLLDHCERLLKAEPTLVEIQPPTGSTVAVVGDTHGQFHDVCKLFEVVGAPSPTSLVCFNGDFVDRGAWGLETLVLLAAWKLALPSHVFLLRGNHESATCTLMYGFKPELVAKYGKGWRTVYAACKRMFCALPLAARIGQHTLVLHGGLFRRQPQRSVGRSKRKRLDEVMVGSLDDLRSASKGGADPNGVGASRLATDVLWSDPVGEPGFQPNVTRGVGMVFGPDVTEGFLAANGLRLILRSHEGPDAREGRDDMQPMMQGYTLDHDTASGKLMTVFSAPDYPQFVPADAPRYNNLAAVAVLAGPDYDTPTMKQFEAALPRPTASPYYELWVNDSDEEWAPAASDASGMSDVQRATSTCGASSSLAAASDAAGGADGLPSGDTASSQPVGGEVQQRQQQHQQQQGVEQGEAKCGATAPLASKENAFSGGAAANSPVSAARARRLGAAGS